LSKIKITKKSKNNNQYSKKNKFKGKTVMEKAFNKAGYSRIKK